MIAGSNKDMRKLMFVGFIVLLSSASMLSQVPPPPVADNANPQDRSLKDRSVGLERAKREEAKGVVTGKSSEAISAAKFNEIKEDFEQLQITQSAIVEAYRTAKNIDYKLISTGAEQVVSRGERLARNLFPPGPQKEEQRKKDQAQEQQPELRVLPDDIRSLIVEMDNTLGVFVANPMFSDARIANAANHATAQSDLEYLIALGKKLQLLSAVRIATK
jgi:hypothetical protein